MFPDRSACPTKGAAIAVILLLLVRGTVLGAQGCSPAVIEGTVTDRLAGMQVFNNTVNTQAASSTDFPGPGIEVVGAGASNITVGEAFNTTINGGYFAQTQVGWHSWVFGTLGGRYDRCSRKR